MQEFIDKLKKDREEEIKEYMKTGDKNILKNIFIIEIIKCITNKPSIEIIPFDIGIPGSVIGIDAKSAIIIAIASSNG